MTETPTVSDECVVLKSMNYRESDRIVTVFSKAFGKKNLLARGACSENSKLAGFTDSLSIIQYVPKKTKTFTLLAEPGVISPLFHIKEFGTSCFAAFAAAELVMRCSEFDSPMPDVYGALKDSLVLLDLLEPGDDRGAAILLVKFKLFFIEQLGFAVNFDHCMSCGAKLGAMIYDTVRGGNVCGRCSAGPGCEEVAVSAVRALRAIASESDVRRILSARYEKGDIFKINEILKAHIRANLHVTLASEKI